MCLVFLWLRIGVPRKLCIMWHADEKISQGKIQNAIGCSGMMKKPKMLHWWLFAALTFLICVLLQVPAAWLVAKFYPKQHSLHNISGNIWSGQADWSKGQLRGLLKWQVRPLDLLRLRAAANLDLHSGQSQLEGVMAYSLGKKIIIQDLNGQVAPDTLKNLAAWQWPSNHLQLEDVSLHYKPEQGFIQAQGQVNWAGGELLYRYAERQERMNVPMLKANLAAHEGKLVLDGRDNREQKMLNLSLDQQMMLDVQLTQRLLLNVPSYQGKAGLDTYVLSTRQPLFRGLN